MVGRANNAKIVEGRQRATDAISTTTERVFLGTLSSAPTDSDYESGQVALYFKNDNNLYKRPHGGTESQVGGGGGGYDLSVDEGDVALGAGETYVVTRIAAADHDTTTLEVKMAGVSDSSFAVPAGLEIRIYDETNTTELFSSTATFEKGDPLASVSVGSADIVIELNNGTANTVDASGRLGASYV